MFSADYVTVTQEQLQDLIEVLQLPANNASVARRRPRALDEIVRDGWCPGWRLEDLMLMLDRRIGRTHFSRHDDLAQQLKLEERFAFRQNFDPDEGPIGHTMFSAAAVACVMIWFERLGFDVDPAYICRKLAGEIRSDRLVSEDEITVLTYQGRRHAMPPLTVGSENRRFPGGEPVEFLVGDGYRAVVHNDAEGLPVLLEVHAPKYVEPRPQNLVSCDVCKMNYVSGIRSDEHSHNIEHRKVVTTLRPVPSRALRRAVSIDPEAVWVEPDSPNWMSEAVYRRARAFKREFNYDWPQWEVGHEPDATGFLFHDHKFRIVGACCFRPESSAQPDITRLDWIWICPEMRRSGLLSKNWDRFRERFGEFLIEPPISEAMQSFLRKRGDAHLIR